MLANKKSLLALSVASALTLTGCFSDDDNDVVVNPPVTPTDPVVVAPDAPAELGLVVNANVVDAATQNVVSAQVSFLENGEAATNIVDANGNELKTVETANGNVTFTKKADADITEVTVSVTAEGYIGKSFVVALTADEGVESVAALLALTSKEAEGIADVVVSATVTDGTTAEPITAAATGEKASAGATIPAGVQLLGANGEPVSGEISLNVSAADSTSSAAAAIIPEGLNGGDAATTEKAAGVANVLMADANGNKVKSFSSPITITMAIPADTQKDGEAIETGDTLSLKSHNEDTGEWQNEDNVVTIGELNAETNTYTGSFETDHLTFFASTVEIEACSSDISVNVSGDAVPASGLYVVMSSSSVSARGSISGGATSTTVLSADSAKSFGIPSTATAKVSVFDVNGNEWFSSDGEVAVCGTVNAALSNPVELVDEEFTVTATCSNDADQSIDMSNALVTYAQAGKAQTVASGTGGTFTLSGLVSAATYNVTVDGRVALASGGTTGTTTITADGTAESLALSVACATTTGGN